VGGPEVYKHKKKILFIVNNRNVVVVVVFFALVLYLLRTDARAIEISFTSSNGSSHPFYSDCHPPLFLSLSLLGSPSNY
jgi:hypothetical protein